MKSIFKKYFKYIVLASILYMPLFGHLDSWPIRIWDEARLAISAYEMNQNNNFLVTYFEGEPDMWSTKPPLMIWMQVICMKIFGVNELAVRLPSALSALLTCIVLLLFAKHYLKSFWLGFIAAVVLITSHGYVDLHGSRTGDYDVPLALFMTLGALLFFVYCEKKKSKYLYLFFLALTLGVLTKGIAGLLFIPAIFIYGLIRKEILPLLKNKHFYFGAASFLFVIVGYYALREIYNPGFFEVVQKNELGGRYLDVIEGHKRPFWWYYSELIKTRFSAWYLLVPCGLLIGLFSNNQKIKRLTIFSGLLILTFFLIISIGQTKLRWYDIPLFPVLSILVAIFLHYVFQYLKSVEFIRKTLTTNVVPFLFLFLVMIIPYKKMINRTYNPQEQKWRKDFYDIGYYLRDAVDGKHDLNNKLLVYQGYYAHNLFYINILKDQGVDIDFKNRTKLQAGNVVIVPQQEARDYIEKHYDYKILRTDGNIVTYKINARL